MLNQPASEIKIFLASSINTMAAGASAIMVLTMKEEPVLDFHKGQLQTPVPSHEDIESVISMYPETNSSRQD